MLEEEFIDLITLISSKDLNLSKIKVYINDIVKNNSVSQLSLSSLIMSHLQDLFDNYEFEKKSVEEQRSFIIGQLSVFFLYEKCEQERLLREKEFEIFSLIVNCKEVLRIIKKNPGINQKKLNKELNLTKCQFNILLDEISDFKLIYKKDYRVYLTALGREYYDYLNTKTKKEEKK